MKLTSVLMLIALGVAGLYGYDRMTRPATPVPDAAQPDARARSSAGQYDRPWGQGGEMSAPAIATTTVARTSTAPSGRYSCDGRTYCSQMRSCNEAKYFLRHCPNTKMDGDRDGIPCEDQWCR